jgi:hypothetical protein
MEAERCFIGGGLPLAAGLRVEAQNVFKDGERTVETRVVPAIFDDIATMGNGRPVAPKEPSHFLHRKTARHVTQVHRHLTVERDAAGHAGGRNKVLNPSSKNASNSIHNQFVRMHPSKGH